ncbi:MAG: ATP-binding protein [Candidatus Aminicenantes bacterium]|nr:ATP-binding protein [Candidatus Aminicenantes bacterium]
MEAKEFLVERHGYIKTLEKYLDKPLIKVLTGMRRSGKSSLMRILIRKLLEKGVPSGNIVYVNKESLEFDAIEDYRDLNRFVKDAFKKARGNKYIFIDEIQEIASWEKAVSSLMAEKTGDVFISGSNAHLLSSELATLISGRYVEVIVRPLSFGEYLEFRKESQTRDLDEELRLYLKYGGLPGIHFLSFDDETIFGYLNSILNTVLFKDVIAKNSIRDVSALERIVKYLMDNIGNVTTAKRIADYFKAQRITISTDTVLNYIRYLENGFLVKKANRYDLKGRKVMEFYDKIFLSDIGLRNGMLGFKESDIGGILENLVYNELLFRGYRVFIGVLGGLEVDFVAEKQNERLYCQVCSVLSAGKTAEREFGNLEKIHDNYKKIVISMNKFFGPGRKGIEHKYLVDFLLESRHPA